MKKYTFETVLEKFYDNLWYQYIIVPPEIFEHFKGTDRRVMCQVGDLPAFNCALMPKGDGDYFINFNKERRKKLGVNVGDKFSVTLWKDESEYGMPVPEEMQELLLIDDEGSHYFHQLTKGKQRTLLYTVAKPKTSATRVKKAVVILDYLKEVEGKLDFKELNQAFKDASQRERDGF